jgi:plastocyanin
MIFAKLRIRSLCVTLASLVLSGVALAGGIAGSVNYDGRVPNLRPIKMDADPGCAKKHSTPVQSEMLVLGEGNTLANVFVKVSEGAPSGGHPTPPAATLDQNGCRYSPHVLGLMVGQDLKILNSDGLLHNIHGLPKVNQAFNQAMPAAVKELVKTFDKEEKMFKVKCDVHPWMGAYISVVSHPFFDVTSKDGKFEIKGLAAGSYTIEAWHEKLGTKTAKVTISGDEVQTADFTFAPPPR